jgi:hypothetical protein
MRKMLALIAMPVLMLCSLRGSAEAAASMQATMIPVLCHVELRCGIRPPLAVVDISAGRRDFVVPDKAGQFTILVDQTSYFFVISADGTEPRIAIRKDATLEFGELSPAECHVQYLPLLMN